MVCSLVTGASIDVLLNAVVWLDNVSRKLFIKSEPWPECKVIGVGNGSNDGNFGVCFETISEAVAGIDSEFCTVLESYFDVVSVVCVVIGSETFLKAGYLDCVDEPQGKCDNALFEWEFKPDNGIVG